MGKEKILVSACLVGTSCRYDGKSKENTKVIEYLQDKNFILVCPEIMGGLPTPRMAAQRKGNAVVRKDGIDVTKEYERGAEEVLKLAKKFNIKKALLKERSPSCGVHTIHDGTFTGTLISRMGVTAELLKENGIEVYTEEEL